jgi:hypothetical protein
MARRNTYGSYQEKYLRELSITSVGYFTGAIKNYSLTFTAFAK